MKFTLSWLKEHLDTDATLQQISETLTSIGLEVEGIEDAAAELSAFTVAEILDANPHPDADKLQICRVQSDEGELQIVCGAPNARAGIKVALAKVGALIPNGDFKIKKSKIRGVESCGMLCSAKELNLGDDHAGIMELSESATIGQPITQVLGLDDPVIEIAITPNRGDCLGVYGIARDLAAAGLGELKPLPEINIAPQGESPIGIELQTDKCKQFIGVYVKGVKNAPSPDWLVKKLTSVGLRPISTLVDITNYFTMTYGRPLHVYDADKLQGGIIVRDGAQGESFAALNDKSYTLKGGECVIADEKGMLGFGGVVGGEESGVTETTTNVLLECAWFEPVAIAETGRAHEIITDARYRFERTVDKGFMKQGAALATQMIIELCGGVASAPQVAGELPLDENAIKLSAEAINQVAGTEIGERTQTEILGKLGFIVRTQSDGSYEATPPSWRPDVTLSADIAEEILRIYGYDKVEPVSLPKASSVTGGALDAKQQRERLIRRTLATNGLDECHHWAFMSDTKATLFGNVKDALVLQNPISSDLNIMRPSLLPHLLDAASRNHARGHASIRLFEVGPAFNDTGEKGQQSVAATLRAGAHHSKQWQTAAQNVDWSHAKADVIAVLEACGVDSSKLQIVREAPNYYHPGRSGAVKLGPKNTLAYFGELHPYTLQAMDVELPVVACEVFLDAVPMPKAKAPQPLKRSDFPSVGRDFAFLLNHSVEADTLLRAVRGADKDLIQQVHLFDVYSGKGLQDDEKSLAIRITLQATDRTLKEDEIDAVSKSVIASAEKIGAKLRA